MTGAYWRPDESPYCCHVVTQLIMDTFTNRKDQVRILKLHKISKTLT